MNNKRSPIRILQVFASLDRGGAETMIMNIYRKIDRDKIQFDFVVNDRKEEYDFEQEILSLGGRIFRIPKYNLKNIFQYRKYFDEILKENSNLKIIHGHHTVPANTYIKVAHENQRIVLLHSHTAGKLEKSLKSEIKTFLRRRSQYSADGLVACGEKAAKFMFDKKYSSTIIIKNAIETDKYYFNKDIRNKYRQDFNLSDNFVIGHVGNFREVKNHKFIIEIFEEVKKHVPKSKLLLVGDGYLREEIVSQIEKMHLSNDVILAGVRDDVNNILQAMDIMVFPSLFEGLGVALIEAQVSGLKVLASNTITKEANITGNVIFFDIKKGANYWAKEIIKYHKESDREVDINIIINSGYDINSSIGEIEKFYLNLYREYNKKYS